MPGSTRAGIRSRRTWTAVTAPATVAIRLAVVPMLALHHSPPCASPLADGKHTKTARTPVAFTVVSEKEKEGCGGQELHVVMLEELDTFHSLTNYDYRLFVGGRLRVTRIVKRLCEPEDKEEQIVCIYIHD
jgi:hypothetical protein